MNIDSYERINNGTFEYVRHESFAIVTAFTGELGEAGHIAVPSEIDGLETVAIAADAFAHNLMLRSVDIAQNVRVVGDRAFIGCAQLSQVTLPESADTIGAWCFYGTQIADLALPEKLKTIGEGAFFGCTHLTRLDIPCGVQRIGNRMCFACTALKNVTIPPSVSFIGAQAFFGCTSLLGVTIPESVEIIGERAFGGCTSMLRAAIGQNVRYFGTGAFENCPNLIMCVREGSLAHTHALDNDISVETVRV